MAGIYEAIPASLDEVEAFAESLTPEYLYCRVWHHDPAPNGLSLATDEERAQRQKYAGAFWSGGLVCTHGCGVRWRILANSEGEILMRKLDYSDAPGYVMEGKGRINAQGNQVLRKTYFMRSVGGPSGSTKKAPTSRRRVAKPKKKGS